MIRPEILSKNMDEFIRVGLAMKRQHEDIERQKRETGGYFVRPIEDFLLESGDG